MKGLLFSLFIMAIISCGTQKKFDTMKKKFDWQGHRGARGLAPENTIPAMRVALDNGVTTLEVDVVITKDSQVVVSHDPYFNHHFSIKPNGMPVSKEEERSLNLYNMTYDEVRKYDVGLISNPSFPKQEKIAAYVPLLSELIDSSDAHARSTGRQLPFYNIEIKSGASGDGILHPAPSLFSDLVIKVIADKKLEDRCNVQSFDKRILQYFHRQHPGIILGLLVGADGKTLQAHLDELAFIPQRFGPHYSIVDKHLVTQVKEKGMLLIPWTVNDVAQMKLLIALGVDGIITDYPNMIPAAGKAQ